MAQKDITLSVALAVYNEAVNIERCLTSVRNIADEIVVVDGGSADETISIAGKFGATVIQTDNPPMFHINKQKALDNSRGTWILQLDADEVVSESLKKEIVSIIKQKDVKDGYYIPRRNYFLGEWLRKGGQYPDYVVRLFRNGKGKFPCKSVHEQIDINGSVGYLKYPFEHYSYTSVFQYWKKSAGYIRLTASEIPKQNSLKLFLSYIVIKPIATFVALYFRHKGFLDGWRGLLFAFFSSMHFPKAYVLSLSQPA